MAKGIYFGVGDKARKVKKLYFGVNNVARKVKKMYFGVDGKARICYSSGLSSRKTPGQFSQELFYIRNSKVGDYMLRSYNDGKVETLNKSFVKGNATPFQFPTYSSGAAWNPSYAIFGCGYYTASNTTTDYMYTYTTNLVHDRIYDISRGNPTGGNVGSYAVISGGVSRNDTTYPICNLYNQSLTKTELPGSTYFSRMNAAVANIGDKILLAGGSIIKSDGYVYSSKVVYINSSGGWGAVTDLPIETGKIGGAGNDNYVLFAGIGYTDNSMSVTAYNHGLARIIPSIPTRREATNIVARVGDYIVIFGGSYGGAYLSEITTYNQNLVMDVSDETLINPTWSPNVFEFNNGAIVTYRSGTAYDTYFYEN